jgi:thiazole synthase
MMSPDKLIIANRSFGSRLFLGTGKFSSVGILKDVINESNSEMITVALRRVDINSKDDGIISAIDRSKQVLLPNTSGARNSEEAIRLARIARAGGCGDWIKLEVTPEPRYLLPDPIETLKAAEQLVKDGFIVLPYINADPILAKYLEEAGCSAVMPLGSPIGSNRGIKTIDSIRIIIEQSNVPVVVDAGLGAPSDASLAMELGADAVLVNTAIASAKDPVMMALAFKEAVVAGRRAYMAGLGKRSLYANASSPTTGVSELSSSETKF